MVPLGSIKLSTWTANAQPTGKYALVHLTAQKDKTFPWAKSSCLASFQLGMQSAVKV
jgi:hypothetical protein